MSEVLMRVEHLKKTYGNVTPIEDISIEIKKGDIISIIGGSGVGKSTFLRMLNQLEKPTAGKIFFHDEEITAPNCKINLVRQKIGMIFQGFHIFPNLTAIENIMAAPLELKGVSKQAAYDAAKNLLKSVGLFEKAFNYPDELSGGQQQRIAIVRALAMDPEILLFDEPTSALDPTMVSEVESVIKKVADSGSTMLIVTHSMEFARKISNRVLYFDEGGIYEEGTPEEIFENPKKPRTIQFIKGLKILKLEINSVDFDFIGMNSEIENFANKHSISKKVLSSLFALFEEICIQIILPQLKIEPRIKIIIEYSQKAEITTMKFLYNGEYFDIRQTDNALSLSIVKGNAAQIDYQKDFSEEFKNCIDVVVKN